MRNLSEKEKEIIKDILFRSEECNSDWVDLSCIYLHIFWNNKVSYESGTLYLPYENINDEDSIKFQREFFETTILLKQLEENRYIHIMDKSMDSNKIKGRYICSDKPLPKGYTLKLSPEVSQIFDDANNKQLFVSQRLRTLVENDFKTYEDIQLEEARKQTGSAQESFKEAQRQTRWSIGAVCLSILTLIASIVMPIILSKCSTDPIENKMVKSQFDSIQSKQNELINTLYPLKNIQITNDSLIKELNELKISQIDNDSLIKELNLLNQSIDEISNTLKELKKMNSKGK